jgi:16S rRNA (guanine966-N2)-methyltransferase
VKVLKGYYKGIELATPDHEAVRPTVDHFKKHIIRFFEETKPLVIWDLFAGSGGVGIEFLSLGARHVVFVEQLKQALACLRLNLGECQLKDPPRFSAQKAQVIQAPVERFLKEPSAFDSVPSPDLVFLDPPYGQGYIKKFTPLLLSNPLCSEKTLFMAEHVVDDPLPNLGDGGALIKQEIYGPKILSLFRKGSAP